MHTPPLYLLADESKSIATEGVEGNVPISLVISGGTGPFKGYIGEQRQEMLGFKSAG